jgi:hypothetical protein
MTCGVGENRKSGRASRIAYELVFGAIPPGQSVLHRCDHPWCCNYHHLFLGTQLDNIADRHSKGRDGAPRGEQHGASKLKDADVVAIRARWAVENITNRELAAEYGISPSTMKGITGGRSWRHIPMLPHTHARAA